MCHKCHSIDNTDITDTILKNISVTTTTLWIICVVKYIVKYKTY
jgi:hypothetical protein